MGSHRQVLAVRAVIALTAITTLVAIACTETTRPLTRQEGLEAAMKASLKMAYDCGTTFKVTNTTTSFIEATWRVVGKSDSGLVNVLPKVGTKNGITYFTTDSSGTVQLSIDTTVVATAAVGTKRCSIHLLTTVGPGVSGSPTTPDSTVGNNKKIAYSYTLQPGYQNLLVTVDGNFVPASGTISMDSSNHVLIASADPILTLSADLQPLYSLTRQVLTAGDPIAATQALLDAEVQYTASLDPATAAARLQLLDFLSYDDSADAAAIQRVSSAIAGHAFVMSANGSAAARVRARWMRARRMGASGASGASRVPSRRRLRGETVSTDTSNFWEPTDMIYTNGIRTNALDAHADAVLLVDNLVQDFPTMADTLGPVTMRYVVNYPYADQQPPVQDRLEHCALKGGSLVDFGDLGRNSWKGFIAKCMQDTTYRRMSDHDLLEAAQQWFGLITGTPMNTTDRDSLFNAVTISRSLGRHVILIGHSQGNLIDLQVLTEMMSGSNPYNRQTDSLCVAAMSIASPTSSFWSSLLPPHYLQHVVQAGDLVADEPTNLFPRTYTDSSLAYFLLSSLTPPPDPVRYGPFGYERIKLHYLSTYLAAVPTKQQIVDDVDSLYNACATDSLTVTPPSVQVQTGTTSPLSVVAKNQYGDTLPMRAIKYAVLTPAVDTIDSTGVVTGRTVGSDSAIVSRYRVRVSVPVTVSQFQIIDSTSHAPFALVNASGTWTENENTLTISEDIPCTVFGCEGNISGTYTGPPLLPGTHATVSGQIAVLSDQGPQGWPVSGFFSVTFPAGTPGNPSAPPGQPWNDTWELIVFPLNNPNPEIFVQGCDLGTCPAHLFRQ